MAKKKRLNKRLVFTLLAFTVLVGVGGLYIYIKSLPEAPETYLAKVKPALAETPPNYEKAMANLSKAIGASGKKPNVELYYQMAELCFDRAKNDPTLSPSARSAVRSMGFRMLVDKALVQQQTFIKARRLLAEKYWEIALAYRINWKLWKDYIKEVDKILQQDKNDADLYHKRGIAKNMLAQTEPAYKAQALIDFREAVSIKPDNLNYWNSLCRFLVANEKYDEAERAYKQSIEANPNKASARVRYSAFLLKRKREKEALKVIQQAIQCQPDSANGNINLAMYYLNKNQLDKAAEALEQAKKIDKTNVHIYDVYRRLYRKKNDIPATIKVLQEGLALLNEEKAAVESTQQRLNILRAREQLNFWLAEMMLDTYALSKDRQAAEKLLAQAKQYHEALMKLDPKGAHQYLIAGRIAVTERKWQKARENLEQAQARSRGLNLRVAGELVNVYQQLKLPGLAETMVQQLLRVPNLLGPGKASLLLQQARFRMNLMKYDDARALADQARRLDPKNKQVEEILHALDIIEGKADAESGSDAAEGRMTRLMRLRQVRELLLDDKPAEAEAILEKMLKRNPKDREALSMLISLLQRTDRRDEAIQRVKEALKADPGNEALKKSLVLLAESDVQKRFKLEMGYTEQISNPLQKALQKWELCLRYGHPAEATKFLREAEKINPKHSLVVEGLFSEALNKQDWAVAEKLLTRLEQDSAIRDIYAGRLAIARSQFEQAISHLEAGLKKSPQHQAVRVMLAQCYMQTKEWKQAKAQFQICLRNNRRDVLAMAGLARLAGLEQDHKEHEKWILQAYRFPEGRTNSYIREQYLQLMETKLRNLRPAIKKREKLLADEPNNLNNIFRLALLYEKDRQWDKACKTFEQVYSRTTNKLGVLPNLARLYIRLERTSEADKLFAELLKQTDDPKQRVAILVAYADFLARFNAAAAVGIYEKAVAEDKSGTQALRALSNFRATQAMALGGAGKKLESQAKWKEAIALLKKVIQREPQNAVARTILYRRYIDAGMFAEAIAGFEKLVSEDPSDPRAMIGLGLALLRNNQLDKAEKQFDRAIKIDPNQADAYIFRSEVHKARANLPRAVDDIERATRLSGNPILRMDLATLYEAMGNYEAAIQECEKILSDNEDYPPAYKKQINIFARQKNYPAMKRLAEKAMKKFTRDPFFPLALARLAKQRNQDAEEIRMLQVALKIDPENVRVVRQYLRALLNANRYKILMEESGKYLNRPAHKAGVMGIRALAEAKKNPASPEPFRQFLAALRTIANPEDVFVITNFIKEAYGLEKLLAKSAEIIKARPDNWRVYAAIGDAYGKLKKYDQAEKFYVKARNSCTSAPDKLRATVRLAGLYERQGKHEKTEQAYKEILAENPRNMATLNNLAYLYANSMNKPREALKLIERAMQLGPGEANLLDTYAWVLAKLGRFQEARKNLAKIVARGKPSVDTLYHMGYVLENTGAFVEAKEYYRRAYESIRDKPDHPLHAILEKALKQIDKKLD